MRVAGRARLLPQRDTGSGLAIMAATETARGKWEGGKEVAEERAGRADAAGCGAHTKQHAQKKEKIKRDFFLHQSFDHFRSYYHS